MDFTGLEASLPPPRLYIGLTDVRNAGPWQAEVRSRVDRARLISRNEFVFLNRPERFPGETPEWNRADLSQLWRYHLHYFDYTDDLLTWARADESTPAFAVFEKLVTSWLDQNQAVQGDAWHPYPLSLRLVNWINAAEGFHEFLEERPVFRKKFLAAITAHLEVLLQDLEWDVRGNHLLKNLRGLLWALPLVGGSAGRVTFDQILALLNEELVEQINEEGAHFERTPGYHVTVLRDCLEIGLWVRRIRGSAPAWLDSAIAKMLGYLLAILPRDGRTPLLKDTAWDAHPDPRMALTLGAIYLDAPDYKVVDRFGLTELLLFGGSGWEKFRDWPRSRQVQESMALPQSGHFVVRDDSEEEHLIVDAGKPCPDYLPAHAHADLLSFELTIGSQRVVVDSGVGEYAAGPWRDYFRSTRAHNTVEIAEQNQSEVWSSFRVARRARPGAVIWRKFDQGIFLQAEHDGYCRLNPPAVHRRTVVWRRQEYLAVVDEVIGRGETAVLNHLHCHPAVDLLPRAIDLWEISGAPHRLWVTAFGHQGSALVKGATEPRLQAWYSERFGEIVPNPVLSLSARSQMPFCFGYIIARESPARVRVENAGAGYDVLITWGAKEGKVSTAPAGFSAIP